MNKLTVTNSKCGQRQVRSNQGGQVGLNWCLCLITILIKSQNVEGVAREFRIMVKNTGFEIRQTSI